MDSGTWRLNASSNVWAGLSHTRGTIVLGADYALPATGIVSMGAGPGATTAVLDLNGHSQVIRGLQNFSNYSNETHSVSSSQPATLTISNNYDFVYGAVSLYGTIDGAISILKVGLNKQTLSGANSYSGLRDVIIPNSVAKIGISAFSCCFALSSVTIPNSVVNIGGAAFYSCYSLTSVTIPDSVTSIEDATFNGCAGLTNVTIGTSVTNIGFSAFFECYNLRSVVIPDSVTDMWANAFARCSSLSNVVIGNGIKIIYFGVFHSCSSLTSVTIPASVNSIGYQAFYGCTSLTNVTIGSGLVTLGFGGGNQNSVFGQCANLTSVCFQGNAPTNSTDLTVFTNAPNVTLYYLACTTGWGPTFDGRPTALWPDRLRGT